MIEFKKSEMVELAKTKTAKELAEFLTIKCGEPVSVGTVNSALKQFDIKAKGARGTKPFIIVDDEPATFAELQAKTLSEVPVEYASNNEVTEAEAQELYAHNG